MSTRSLVRQLMSDVSAIRFSYVHGGIDAVMICAEWYLGRSRGNGAVTAMLSELVLTRALD